MQYYRLCSGLNDPGTLVPAGDSVYKHIKYKNKDHYKSIFIYNEKHKLMSEEMISTDKGMRKRGVAGIDDVTTNRIVFDFDSEKDIEVAKNDTIELCKRLLEYGVPNEDLQIAFSGKKGFSVEILSTESLTPAQLKNVTINLAGDLVTLDRKIYNASRIIRVPLTMHPDTNLYKMPLSLAELESETIGSIRELAKDVKGIDLEGIWSPKVLPRKIMELKDKGIEAVIKNSAPVEIFRNISEIDWTKKPSFLTPAKYVLHLGLIPPGNRHHCMMILAASFQNIGFDKSDAYRLLKSVAERQAKISGQDRFSDIEIWGNILEAVYSPLWKGGQYGSDDPLLMQIEAQLPSHVKRARNDVLVENGTVFDKFKKFALDIEKNTIKFGLKTLDEGIQLLTGTSVGIVGVPGSGKSTIALDLLESNSLAGECSIFYSLDMNESLIALKQMQRISGLSNKEIYRVVREEQDRFKELQEKSNGNFKNVVYSFRGGVTTKDIEANIMAHEDKTGKKVRLVVIDYLESVTCIETNDPTTGSGMVAQQLTSIAGKLDLLMVILLQTQKHVQPGEPILSIRNIKGSSAIEQSLSVAIGIHREGHSPGFQNDDHSMGVNVLKNRFGQLGSFDIKWNGARSSIGELSIEDKIRLEDLRQRKKEEKANDKNNDGW